MKPTIIVEITEYSYLQKCLRIPAEIIVLGSREDLIQIERQTWERNSPVVVAIKDEGVRQEVLKKLSLAVKDEFILDFYQFYEALLPMRRSDRVLSNPRFQEYEGLIFGISQAEVGLIGERLGVPFANLAVSSQDIYYNYKVLLYAIGKYMHKLQKVKYIIFEMYRYNYFNYDASRSNGIIQYYNWSGILDDPHHYDPVKYRYVEQMLLEKKLQGITNEKLRLWNEIFADVHEADNYKSFDTIPELHLRKKTVEDREVQEYDFAKSIVRKRFDETISENLIYFRDILAVIRKTWPEARIILLHMPWYEPAIIRSEPFYREWKEEFYLILEEFRQFAEFEYIDYFHHPISKERELWYDFLHLNYEGAVRFTEEVRSVLSIE